MSDIFLQSHVPDFPCRRGKVRDVYDIGDTLVIVATDRISAFDWVMPNGIPGKGRLLSAMTKFWLNWLGVSNHFLSDDLADMPAAFRQDELDGRTMLVRKANVIPIECVVRGYLTGSAWKEYLQSGTACGEPLPAGLRQNEHLPDPIFTPTTKADAGHDESISFARTGELVGPAVAADVKARTLDVYRKAAAFAEQKGIIIVDTKLEWGTLPTGEVILIDEVLTPDSSRFWMKGTYAPGTSPPPYDKQFVRDWLEASGWDKNSPPPALPADVVAKTADKYREALARLTG